MTESVTESATATGPAAAPAGSPKRPAIRVRHLWHRYGRAEVLRDVSFDVQRGEIFGFVGPNGAGKTTTIRVLATLLEPLSGRVEVCGHDVTTEPETVRRLLGYMPDHAGVYERVTVGEYLEFFADAHAPSGHGADPAVVQAVLELTDLTRHAEKIVSTLSKGMKQRLQLARVMLHDPEVLVLDEPASDLDPRARIEMRDLLMQLRDMGKTIFLSSHILTELADVCNSVAILEKGALVAAGPIDAIGKQLAQRRGEGDTAAAVHNVRLRALGAPAALAQAAAALPGVTGVAPGPGGTVVVSYNGGDDALAGLVRSLVGAGVPLVGVEPERTELERIFLEVTKGELQ